MDRARSWAEGRGRRGRRAHPVPSPNAQRPTPNAQRLAPNARSGFTLIELCVVMMALVILAAVVVPSLHRAARQGDLDSATTRVAASVRYARETSASRAVTIDVNVETTPPAAVMLAVVDTGATTTAGPSSRSMGSMPGTAANSATTRPLETQYARVLLPEGVTARLEAATEAAPISSTQTAATGLRFPADGHTEGGVIVLNDAAGRERRIVVVPGTGQVVSSSS